MDINLTHTFRYKITDQDLKTLLTGCCKIATYCTRLEKLATKLSNQQNPNDVKGDGLEILVEALIKLSPIDNRIGIYKYEVIDKSRDYGVDGRGIGTNGYPATVQVKYRSNHKHQLTANEDHLSNFVSTSMLQESVNAQDKNNMLIITTAKGLHYFTEEEMYVNKVRCLGYKELQGLLDNNTAFWNQFRELLNI